MPKSAGPFGGTIGRSIIAQPYAPTTHAQHERVLEQLADRFPAAEKLAGGRAGKRVLVRSRLHRDREPPFEEFHIDSG